jgi:hypothetical protein
MNNNGSNEKPLNNNSNYPSSSYNNVPGSSMTINPTYVPYPNVDPNSTSAVNVPYAAYPVPVQLYTLPNQGYPPPPQGFTTYPQYYQQSYPPAFVQGYPATETSKVDNPPNNSQNILPAYQGININCTDVNTDEKRSRK